MALEVHLDIPEVDLREGTIVEAVAGRVPHISPSAALSLLGEVDLEGVDRQRLLRDAVRNAELDAFVRAGAVQIYARLAGGGAVPALLRALEDGTERVAAAVATALGRVGSPEQLDVLGRLRSGEGGRLLRARATFAEALIIHRFGLADRESALPPVELLPAPPPTDALTFTSARPGLAGRDRVLKAVKRDLPEFDVAKQDVYEVQCGPKLLEIAVDRDFVGPEGLERLRSGPAVPAVVAMQNQEHGDFYLGLIALSSPDGSGGVTVRLSRPGGDAVYVAGGSPKGSGLDLDLLAVRAPGATPVAGLVRLTASAVEISGTSSPRSNPARIPQQM
ncbi:MAG TPA: HEAT repeat domain-containing protein, partial [Umezawaea sp.]|nr:HEAT repeat domain-containing protein [Umezawaea sp.]